MKKFMIGVLIFFSIVSYALADNDTTGKTWVLDSTGSVWTSTTQIVWIIWTDIGTDDDDLVIHDSSGGSVIVKLKGKDPQSEEIFDEFRCSLSWLPILSVEHSLFERQTGAAVEGLRNVISEGVHSIGDQKQKPKLLDITG